MNNKVVENLVSRSVCLADQADLFIGDFHLVNGRIGSSNYVDFCRGIKVLTSGKISYMFMV